MKVPLTRGLFCEIDESDYHLICNHKWHAIKDHSIKYADKYYAANRQLGSMHRHILGITDVRIMIDHRDGDGLNNRRSNLRECTHKQNMQNRKQRFGSSKYKGVSWSKPNKKWKSKYQLDRQEVFLGYFDSEVDAAIAYNAAVSIAFGEFALMNIIEPSCITIPIIAPTRK